jgi:hypothetical protein
MRLEDVSVSIHFFLNRGHARCFLRSQGDVVLFITGAP